MAQIRKLFVVIAALLTGLTVAACEPHPKEEQGCNLDESVIVEGVQIAGCIKYDADKYRYDVYMKWVSENRPQENFTVEVLPATKGGQLPEKSRECELHRLIDWNYCGPILIETSYLKNMGWSNTHTIVVRAGDVVARSTSLPVPVTQ